MNDESPRTDQNDQPTNLLWVLYFHWEMATVATTTRALPRAVPSPAFARLRQGPGRIVIRYECD